MKSSPSVLCLLSSNYEYIMIIRVYQKKLKTLSISHVANLLFLRHTYFVQTGAQFRAEAGFWQALEMLKM